MRACTHAKRGAARGGRKTTGRELAISARRQDSAAGADRFLISPPPPCCAAAAARTLIGERVKLIIQRCVLREQKSWRASAHVFCAEARELALGSPISPLPLLSHLVFFSQPAASLPLYLSPITFLMAGSDEPERCWVRCGANEGERRVCAC